MKKRAKLLFLIPSLRGGGAERVAINLFPFLSKHFDLTVALLEGKIEYELPSVDFKIIFISNELGSYKKHLLYAPIHIIKFYSLVKHLKPDIVLSFMEQANIINLLVSKLTRHKTVITQHIVPSKQFHNKGKLGRIILNVAKILYSNAGIVVAVSNGIKKDLLHSYCIKNVVVIPNPIDFKRINQYVLSAPNPQIKERFFLCPGRLVIAHKAQDLLFEAFKEVLKNLPNINLLLAGEGSDFSYLKQLAKKLAIYNNVIFSGWRHDLWKLMANSIATVLPSRYEGWPMVLLEAMAAGSPVIATNCPSGPEEILDGGRFGMLIPMEDKEALAKAMIKMACLKELREHYKIVGQKRAQEFDIEIIGMRYVEEIFKVLES